jgi:FlaA1/EpsC-like NDP-sugar epimerase
MEIPEAVALILQAVNIDQGDNLFVLDMGNPVNIYGLAQDMINISGKDLPIEITGLRPGEKIHEELFYPSEGAMGSRWDGILQGTPTKPSDPPFSEILDVLEKRALAGRTLETHSLLKQLVPEYE